MYYPKSWSHEVDEKKCWENLHSSRLVLSVYFFSYKIYEIIIQNGKTILRLELPIFRMIYVLNRFDLDTAQLAATEKTKTTNNRKTINGVKKFGYKYEARMRIQVIITVSHKDKFSMIQPPSY